MENIEALTYLLILLAIAAGIGAAFLLPVGKFAAVLAVSFYFMVWSFSPLTSAHFHTTFVGGLGMSQAAFEIATLMILGFGLAAAAGFVYCLLTGRIRRLPPAI